MLILEEIGVEFRGDAEALALWREAGAKTAGERVRIPRELAMDRLALAPAQFTQHARNPARSVENRRPESRPRAGLRSALRARSRRQPAPGDTRRPPELHQARVPPPGPQPLRRHHLRAAGRARAEAPPGDLPRPRALFRQAVHGSGERTGAGAGLRGDGPHRVPGGGCSRGRSGRPMPSRPTLAGPMVARPMLTGPMPAGPTPVGPTPSSPMPSGPTPLETNAGERTVLISLVNGNSPLVWDATMLGAMKVYARHRQALLVSPFIMQGANTPVTTAGALAQLNAEAVAGMAFAQLVRAGTPVVYGNTLATVSMQVGGRPPTAPRRRSSSGLAIHPARAALRRAVAYRGDAHRLEDLRRGRRCAVDDRDALGPPWSCALRPARGRVPGERGFRRATPRW